MSFWTASRVADALGMPWSGPDRPVTAIATDTRTLVPEALFVALAGERFDGHDFLGAAHAAGAVGAVVRRGTAVPTGLVAFEVEDTLVALGRLARYRRRAVRGPVVAVTGTNGKTTTKELLAAALRPRWRTQATAKNLNNLVGAPLTILGASDDCEALVVEAGASVPGEIARLRDIIEPTVGVVTNVAPGHLEGFGSVADVLREKSGLLTGVELAVVGTEPDGLAARAREKARRVLVAGTGPGAQIRPERWALDAEGRAAFTYRGSECRLNLVGRHQVDNAMIALATAEALGVGVGAAAAALERVTIPGGRCEVLRRGDLVLLHDAYNANPASVDRALDTAEAIGAGRPLVVVVGSMLELGADSAALHRAVAERVMAVRPALIGATGLFIPAFETHRRTLGDRLVTAEDAPTLGRRIGERLTGREVVLLKASRGVQLERAIAHILPDDETPCSTTF